MRFPYGQSGDASKPPVRTRRASLRAGRRIFVIPEEAQQGKKICCAMIRCLGAHCSVYVDFLAADSQPLFAALFHNRHDRVYQQESFAASSTGYFWLVEFF